MSILLLVLLATLKADRVFVNGHFYTEDPQKPWAEALAVRGQAILAVGPAKEILKLKEAHSDVVDLRGRLVLPGFIDSHVQLLEGGLALHWVRLNGLRGSEIEKAIASYTANNPDSFWVIGRGLPRAALKGGRSLLDRLVPHRPTLVFSEDGHTALCNGVALLAARITRGTPDPPRGTIGRDPKGEPTGVLNEGAIALVRQMIPPPSEDEKRKAISAAMSLVGAQGTTSVVDAGIDAGDLPIYARVLREEGIKVRVTASLPMEKSPGTVEDYKQLRATHKGALLRIGPVRCALDGIVATKTAALLEPYPDGGTGVLNVSPEELREGVRAYDKEGFQIVIDANGDRAVRVALDAFEDAAKASGTSRRRHQIEGLEFVHPADIARLRPLDVVASTFPTLLTPGNLEVYSETLGPERAAKALAFRLLDEGGAVQAFGTGWPAAPCDVLRAISTAVTGGRISIADAVRHFTRDAAYATFEEGTKGALVPGALADLVVLSENVIEEPQTLSRAKILATFLGGQDAYRVREF